MWNIYVTGLSMVLTSFLMSIPIGMGVWVGFWICSTISRAIEIRVMRRRLKDLQQKLKEDKNA